MSFAQPNRQQVRIVFALLVALSAAATKWYAVKSGLNPYSDFDELWVGARALLAGRSPYAAVGLEVHRWPLYYPIYAVAAHAPLVAISLSGARIVYVGLASFAFSLAITRNDWVRWPAVLSASFLIAIANGQWSPLLVAAIAYPALSFLLVSKPTTGGALVLAYAPELARRRSFWIGLIVAGLLATIGTVIDPRWPAEWWAATRLAPQVRAPISYAPWLGSTVVILCLLRWRRPEARLVAILVVIPHSFVSYELLLLFLVPATLRQTTLLALATWIAELLGGFVADFPEAVVYEERHALWYLSLVYLPCVAMVLLRRNQGEIPSALEARLGRWPGWLRGERLLS